MSSTAKLTAEQIENLAKEIREFLLEHGLWHVIEDYMVQFGIRTQDDEPDWATVKAVQDSIFTAFTDAGVNFKFLSDEKLGEIEKAIKKKESKSWAAKRKKNR